jgi:hypothetical protein
MVTFNQPNSILGYSVRNVLLYRANEPKFQALLNNWKKTIVVDVKHLYAISIIFDEENITIEYDIAKNYDLYLTLSLET